MKRHKTVDEYIANADRWRDELVQLRKILNSTELVEEVKWGGPCYTSGGKNVVGMGAFKKLDVLFRTRNAKSIILMRSSLPRTEIRETKPEQFSDFDRTKNGEFRLRSSPIKSVFK